MKFYFYVIIVILIFSSYKYDPILAVEDPNTIDMTVLCDSVEMDGKFNIEFINSRPLSILSSKKPKPIIFESLIIESSLFSVKGCMIDKDKNIRIESIDPNTQLFLYKEQNKPVDQIYISKITAVHEYSKIKFYNDSGECNITFGRRSMVYLENRYQNTDEWQLKIEGKFQIIGEDLNFEVMENEKIKFKGNLQIISPQFPDNLDFKLNFNYHFDIENKDIGKKGKIELLEGQVRYISRNDYAPNEFSVENYGMFNKNEIIENDFRVDMSNEYYQVENADRYLYDFKIDNIQKGGISKIETKGNRLSITSKIEYHGESLFPKIKVTSKYYIINKDGTWGEPEIETSNLTDDRTPIKIRFLDGRRYRIEILVEKLIKDDLVINYTIKGPHENKTENQVKTGKIYPYEFRCEKLPFNQQPIECYLELMYQKNDSEEIKQYNENIVNCYAEIYSEIIFEIEEIKKIKTQITENEKFEMLKRLKLVSETSDPIDVCIFIVTDSGVDIESGEYLLNESLRKGKFMDISARFRAPFIKENEIKSKIKIFIFYKIEGSENFSLYLPEPTMKVSIIEDITITKDFWRHIIEFLPSVSISFIPVILSIMISYNFIPGKTSLDSLIKSIKEYDFIKNRKYLYYFILLLFIFIIFGGYLIIVGLISFFI